MSISKGWKLAYLKGALKIGLSKGGVDIGGVCGTSTVLRRDFGVGFLDLFFFFFFFLKSENHARTPCVSARVRHDGACFGLDDAGLHLTDLGQKGSIRHGTLLRVFWSLGLGILQHPELVDEALGYSPCDGSGDLLV